VSFVAASCVAVPFVAVPCVAVSSVAVSYVAVMATVLAPSAMHLAAVVSRPSVTACGVLAAVESWALLSGADKDVP